MRRSRPGGARLAWRVRCRVVAEPVGDVAALAGWSHRRRVTWIRRIGPRGGLEVCGWWEGKRVGFRGGGCDEWLGDGWGVACCWGVG